MKTPDFIWLQDNIETQLYISREVPDLPLTFEPALYFTARHLNSQKSTEFYSFFLLQKSSNAYVACIHFSKAANGFISQANAPFGGITCADTCTPEELDFLLNCTGKWFSKNENLSLLINSSPDCYNQRQSKLLATVYARNGYQVIDSYINCHINVSAGPFSEIITKSEQRRLLKCKMAGFQAAIDQSTDCKFVYDFIKQCRDSSGYKMSVSKERLDKILKNFPDKTLVFTVSDSEKVIAMTVAVRVTKSVLYNFLPAALIEYKHYSPAVLLTESLYQYCLAQDIETVDLGISLDNDRKEKPGLLRFKRNLGGQETQKLFYQKIFKT